MATDLVRVKDKQTKHEYTIPRSRVNEEGHEVLDKPATGRSGEPLPVKYHVPPGSGPASSARPGTGSRRGFGTTDGDPQTDTNDPETPSGEDGQQAGSAEEN